MRSRFFTNDGDNTLLAKFAGVFTHNPDISRQTYAANTSVS